MIQLSTNTIFIFDSANLTTSHQRIFKRLESVYELSKTLLDQEIEQPTYIVPMETPQQTTHNNCGIYTCLYFKKILENDIKLDFGSPLETRREVFQIIKDKEITKYEQPEVRKIQDKNFNFKFYLGDKGVDIKNSPTYKEVIQNIHS